MRTNLKVFRIRHMMSQDEISEKLGVSLATYGAIERGQRGGRPTFWKKLQSCFQISDDEMWELMKND